MTRFRLANLIAVFALVIAAPATGSQEPRASTAPLPDKSDFSQPELVWQQFRNTFPFHLQTIAVSQASPDGTRTLVISEPPPHVTIEGLIAVERTKLANHQVKQWTIGFDGWVKDIVFRLPPMEQPGRDELVRKLSTYLFFTDYKSFALALPANPQANQTKYALDVQVRTTDLDGWYMNRKFLALGNREARKLDGAPAGVYVSEEPGLVVWIVPKRGLENHKADARKFALDSDLILGSIARPDSVAVFGRERIAPVTVLPPLRTEMILTLAASKGNSLSQSYERNAFAAGSSHARWDWAPIYLSPELLDTEYGSILNLTDQMLKGWSTFGLTQYYSFPYSTPPRMPFDGPLRRQLGTDELLFNWNTIGFGIRSDNGTRSIYAMTRTGALPVIYQPKLSDPGFLDWKIHATKRAEKRGYSYFATLNDPFLARAVEYTALYQLFTTSDVKVPAPAWPKWNQSEALQGVALSVLKALRKADEKAIERAVDAEMADLAESSKAANEPINIDKHSLIGQLTKARDDYVAFFKEHKDKGENVVAAILGRTRDFDSVQLRNQDRILDDAEGLLDDLKRSRLPVRLCNIAELQAAFSRSRPPSVNRWLQTPTVVYSRSLGTEALMSGGHDIQKATTRVVRDPMQERGRVQIGKNRELICNPEDAAIIERQARLIAQTDDPGNLKSTLERLLRETPRQPDRPSDTVLGRSSEYHPHDQGLSFPEHLPSASGGNGPPSKPPPRPGTLPPSDDPPQPPPGLPVAAEDVLYVSQKDGQATIRRQSERNRKIEDDKGEHWNQRDLIYALREELEAGGRTADQEPLRIVFGEGFSEAQVRRVMEGLSLHATRSLPGRMAMLCLASPEAMEKMKSPITKADVRGDSITVNQVVESAGRVPLNGSEIRGTIDTATADVQATMEFKIFASGVFPEVKPVQESVTESVKRAQENRVKLYDLPKEVQANLLNDLKAVRAGSTGAFKLTGLGDLFNTRFEHRGRILGTLASIRP